jgi:hypothetical protein
VTWTLTSSGHQVGLLDGKVAVRNPAGKVLRSVPPALKEDPAVVGMRQLLEWLSRHERSCVADVETWMVRSLPIPLTVLVELWPDPSWQRALKDLVVQPLGPKGQMDHDVGLLRDLTPGQGAGLVTLDGDSVWTKAKSLLLPHPVLMPDLDELRGFVVDLGVEQVVPQLFRETWTRPGDANPKASSVQEWSGGRFQQLRHLTSRVTSLGYTVRGGYAMLKIFEDGEPRQARVWIGSDDPQAPAETGELGWTDDRGQATPLREVGPVAWSEGARMAARIYAGRIVDEESAE